MAVAIKVHSDDFKNVEDCTFNELVSFYTAETLQKFVERGGQGLKEAIRDCVDSAIKNGIAQVDKEN